MAFRLQREAYHGNRAVGASCCHFIYTTDLKRAMAGILLSDCADLEALSAVKLSAE